MCLFYGSLNAGNSTANCIIINVCVDSHKWLFVSASRRVIIRPIWFVLIMKQLLSPLRAFVPHSHCWLFDAIKWIKLFVSFTHLKFVSQFSTISRTRTGPHLFFCNGTTREDCASSQSINGSMVSINGLLQTLYTLYLSLQQCSLLQHCTQHCLQSRSTSLLIQHL